MPMARFVKLPCIVWYWQQPLSRCYLTSGFGESVIFILSVIFTSNHWDQRSKERPRHNSIWQNTIRDNQTNLHKLTIWSKNNLPTPEIIIKLLLPGTITTSMPSDFSPASSSTSPMFSSRSTSWTSSSTASSQHTAPRCSKPFSREGLFFFLMMLL